MNSKLIALSRRYQTALQAHVKQGPGTSLRPARALGRQAVVLGLETLGVARIHEAALATLESKAGRDGMIKRAEAFFTEAISPIEKTHRAARKASVRLRRVDKTLGRRTVDLKASRRSLKRGVAKRKFVERALKKSTIHSGLLLKESRRLLNHLQRLTRQILSAQEAERRKLSRELHEEVAQTLLGINVRLLTLKREGTANTERLKKEIASTQRVVRESVRILSRFAHEVGKRYES